jgi:hypothetical protein
VLARRSPSPVKSTPSPLRDDLGGGHGGGFLRHAEQQREQAWRRSIAAAEAQARLLVAPLTHGSEVRAVAAGELDRK